jgi:hypothetical protein
MVRIVRRACLPHAKALSNSQTTRGFQKSGELVGTGEISVDAAKPLIGDLDGLVAENDIHESRRLAPTARWIYLMRKRDA